MANEGSARGALILGAAIVISAVIGAIAIASIKRAGDDITVTGSAKRAVEADFVVWQLDVGVQRPTQLEAARMARDGAAQTRSFLMKQGFPDSAITVRAPTTYGVNEFVNGNMTDRSKEITSVVRVTFALN